MIFMDIGKKIKQLRNAQGLTGIELGKKANIGQSTISAIEAGKRSPTIETVEKICAALGIHVSDLFDKRMIDSDLIILLKSAQRLSPTERQKVIELIKTFVERKDDSHE